MAILNHKRLFIQLFGNFLTLKLLGVKAVIDIEKRVHIFGEEYKKLVTI